MLARLGVRRMPIWTAFPLASPLPYTGSEAVRSDPFADFSGTMKEPDFSCPCIIGYGSSPSQCGPTFLAGQA